TGSLTFGNTNAIEYDIKGSAASGNNDQVQVSGQAILNDANTVIRLGTVPAMGESYMLIDNDGNDPVVGGLRYFASGSYSSLPAGSVLQLSGVSRRISYVGGSGNDVTLTRIDPSQPASTAPGVTSPIPTWKATVLSPRIKVSRKNKRGYIKVSCTGPSVGSDC